MNFLNKREIDKDCSSKESLPNRKSNFSLAKVLRSIGIKKKTNKWVYKNNSETQSDLLFDLIKEVYYKDFSFLYNPAFDQKPEEANLSESFIRGGLNHPLFQIRSFIASNKNTSLSYLEQLAEDENWVVRKSVAANSNTPVKLLETLATDCNCFVKLELLDREDLCRFLRLKLSEDLAKSQNQYIKKQVARNKNTPKNILSQLENDRDPDVRLTAYKQILDRRISQTIAA